MIENIYGEVDKLYKYSYQNNKYKYMTEKQLIHTANKILENIQNTGVRQIIVSECGTYPLVYICKKIAEKEKLSINWFFFKTPRNQNIKIKNILLYYLSDSEKKTKLNVIGNSKKLLTREEAIIQTLGEIRLIDIIDINKQIKPEVAIENIGKIENKEIHNKINDILTGTKLHEIFNKEFIFFDEYVHIGTILNNFNNYASIISKKPNYRLGAYCTYVNEPGRYEQIAFSLYGLDNLEKCFLDGVYPFEDRLDILGYFYYINENEYKKVELNKLKEKFDSKVENKEMLQDFVSKLNDMINKYNILKKLKNDIKEKNVAENVDNKDILRYMLKELEYLNSGDSEYYQVLNEIFETYAPMWLPLPETFHWSYWEGFEINKQAILNIINNYVEEYKKVRNQIFLEVIDNCNQKKEKWKEKINEMIK